MTCVDIQWWMTSRGGRKKRQDVAFPSGCADALKIGARGTRRNADRAVYVHSALIHTATGSSALMRGDKLQNSLPSLQPSSLLLSFHGFSFFRSELCFPSTRTFFWLFTRRVVTAPCLICRDAGVVDEFLCFLSVLDSSMRQLARFGAPGQSG